MPLDGFNDVQILRNFVAIGQLVLSYLSYAAILVPAPTRVGRWTKPSKELSVQAVTRVPLWVSIPYF